MPYYCTVPRCTSMAGKAKNVSFHQFPRDEELAKLWNNILKRGKPYTKYSKVCSLHFRPEDYTITSVGKNKGQWRTLRKDAIPSQNLPLDSPTGTHHRRRGSGAWVPNTLPPNIVDPQMQQQMAQAIYLQTMLAMQAATNGPHHISIPMDPTESQTHKKNANTADHRVNNIDRPPHQNIQEDLQEIQSLNHSIHESQNQYVKTSYKCEECSKCFKDPDVFVLHKRSHMTRNQDIQENLPVTMKGQEKENFNTNSEYSSQETLRANPILANLLKSGISSRVPEMSNGTIDSNNMLSIENQIMTALACNMESYIRNLSSMLSDQVKKTSDSGLEHNSDNLSPNSEQEDVNSEDVQNSDQDDQNTLQDDCNSDQDDQNTLQDDCNSDQDDQNTLQDDCNSVDKNDDNSSASLSTNQTKNAVDGTFYIKNCQNSLEVNQNSPLYLQNYQFSAKDLTENSEDGRFVESRNSPEIDDNIVESRGSVDCEGPSCDNQDFNESKDSSNLVIDDNV